MIFSSLTIMVIIIFIIIFFFISKNAQVCLFKTLGIYSRKKEAIGQQTEASAKVKEEIWSPLKPKKNGNSLVTKFKIAVRCSAAHMPFTIIFIMINGTLA